jgi:hypothetical protein
MPRFNSKRYVLLASVAVIAACVSAPPVPPQTAKGLFAHMQPVPVNVSSVNVKVFENKTGGDFISDPAAVAEDYVKTRFKPQGLYNAIDVTVEEATVRRATKEGDSKVEKFFGVGGAEIYNIVLRVRFDYVESGGRVIYGKVFTARRQMTVSEHASVAEREQFEIDGLKKMFNELDASVQRTVMQEMNLGMGY